MNPVVVDVTEQKRLNEAREAGIPYLLGSARYDRAGDELRSRGLYLDVPPWQCHAFSMTKLP